MNDEEIEKTHEAQLNVLVQRMTKDLPGIFAGVIGYLVYRWVKVPESAMTMAGIIGLILIISLVARVATRGRFVGTGD